MLRHPRRDAHARGLLLFLALVAAHMAEHVVQMAQLAMGVPRAQALGLLGLAWPWLVRSEALHYAYAMATLVGLLVLRPGFRGGARRAWTVAIVLAVWHHVEHAVILAQAVTGQYLYGAGAPMSLLQLLLPRAELHMAYNVMVTLPLGVAAWLHLRAPRPARGGADAPEAA